MKYYNLFLVHKQTNAIFFEELNTNLFNKFFFEKSFQAYQLLNNINQEYIHVFNFLKKHNLLNNKIYLIIRNYILLPLKQKHFFKHFKFKIYIIQDSIINNISCYLINFFFNSLLFTKCIFPLYFYFTKKNLY